MAKVKFRRGNQETYLKAWEASNHDVSKFKYTDSIYFAYDKGILYLDGSSYGVPSGTDFSNIISDIDYTPATEYNPAAITFNKDTSSSKVIYFPHVSSNSSNIISVQTISTDKDTNYTIDFNYNNSGLTDSSKGLSLDLNLNYEDHHIRLKDSKGQQIGQDVDATNFIKDKFLGGAEYVVLLDNEVPGYPAGNYLKLTFNTVNRDDSSEGEIIEGTDIVYIDITKLNKYINGNGIIIDASNKVNISLKNNAETLRYLSLEDGSLGITNLENDLNDVSANADIKIKGLKETIDNYTINDISLGQQPFKISSHNIKVDFSKALNDINVDENYIYDVSDGSLYSGNVAQNDTISVAFIKVQNKMQDLVDNRVTSMISDQIKALRKSIGDAISSTDSSYLPKSPDAYHYIYNLSSLSEEIEQLDKMLYQEISNVKASMNYNDITNLPGNVVTFVNQKDGKIDVTHDNLGNIKIGTGVNSDKDGITNNTTLSELGNITNKSILWHE